MTLGVCRADGRDIGADMVRAGLAWSRTPQTHEYVLEEGMAMARLKGVHAHACRLPPSAHQSAAGGASVNRASRTYCPRYSGEASKL
jgi:endonuclease YncB( thermonuclease family)